MRPQDPANESVFEFSERLTAFPVVHGSGDFAQEVRTLFLARHFDCLAVPLPGSFQREVDRAVQLLPQVHIVTQRGGGEIDGASFVPVEPCQPVIAVPGRSSSGISPVVIGPVPTWRDAVRRASCCNSRTLPG